MYTKEVVFQQKLLEKAYFNVEMTGLAMVRPATQFWPLESAFSIVSNDDWLKMITSENNNLSGAPNENLVQNR